MNRKQMLDFCVSFGINVKEMKARLFCLVVFFYVER